jgi:branched-chain amino acid transport system substrate-binding protein
VRRLPALLLLCALLAPLAGCGGGGASSGATVTVYLSAPLRAPGGRQGRTLCAEAKTALARAHARAGDLHVRTICLDAGTPTGTWTLPRVGANARRAVEDSTTVAYIAEPTSQARLQSRPIIESAGIAEVVPSSGSSSMHQILHAIAAANTESLRDSVRESLSGQ